MRREIHLSVVFKPDDTLRIRLFPEVVATDGGDIQIAIAVEVGGYSGAGSRENSDRTVVKFEIALVFEPLDAMPRPRPGRQVIEGIAIGQQDVDASVPVQVHQSDAAAAKIFVGA